MYHMLFSGKKIDERTVAPPSQRRRRWKLSSQPPSATGCVGARVLSSVYPRMRLLAKPLALVPLTRSRGLGLADWDATSINEVLRFDSKMHLVSPFDSWPQHFSLLFLMRLYFCDTWFDSHFQHFFFKL